MKLDQRRITWSRLCHHYRNVRMLSPIDCNARSVTSFVDPLMVSIRFNMQRTGKQREEMVMLTVL